MTDLTEQWKKGELPSGYYYVKNEFGNIFPSDYSEEYDCISDTVIKDFFTEVSEIKEVLAPVPSYEEWKASEKYNKHLEEKIKVYERKDKQATETSIAYNKLAEENEELKHLVAELKEKIVKMKDIVLNTETNNMKSIIEIVNIAKENAQLKELLKECRERLIYCTISTHDVQTKIDEVLK